MTISENIIVLANSTNTLTRATIDNTGSARQQVVTIQVTSPGATINYAFAPSIANGITTNPAISSTSSYQLTYPNILNITDYDDLVNLVFQNNTGSSINLYVTYGLSY